MPQWSKNSCKAGNITFAACYVDGKPLHVTFEEARILFEPSCYRGDGSEWRLTICFSGASEQIKKELAAMEETTGATSSRLKDNSIRFKINTDKVRSYDPAKKRIESSNSMRGWTVNAQVHVRGKWQTRQGTGLSLEVTDLQFLQEAREPPCPFA